mmetsp:Transcript_23091/g.32979  ORF Transcript_23091/g.32979 Transcript_23091/m.32979 type:complete len:169 (+) Transcript_23091:78-584(+)|eukprot:CAMPEP_0201688458 /NCGR_PEP_ID=MMETSP0578-20130828/2210_1 /ASSEMBLY_ACC=CAM_ASM_000663 /TAXON_ID=267565 /ORGANISM="Skeletonema grethea, Strain CCMP 1804" /LENGTH=168 /DNA_ID=CAMNT_0048172785 /DNA_START=47 /DNA_END=553 /DNA_ORIENTATION=+
MAQLDENNHGGIGLFGDDEEQEQNYNDAADLNDILGLDDEDAADALQPADPEGSLLMRFCPHDSSMLYPKENRSERKLHYACRLCKYTEPANGQLIYKNVLKKEVGNVLHTVPSAVSDDPTLPRSQKAHCGKCGHNEAVFFQSDTSDVRNDTLALIFVCCSCDYKWVA